MGRLDKIFPAKYDLPTKNIAELEPFDTKDDRANQ